jgi:bifunctional NMN adenylyltransferase/nudix hydrolase
MSEAIKGAVTETIREQKPLYDALTQYKKKKEYDLLIFIGRMQPFTLAHKSIIDKALDLAEDVLVLLGSANSASNARNPWSFEDRKKMIEYSLWDTEDPYNEYNFNRVNIKPLNDYPYNNEQWKMNVNSIVDSLVDIKKDKIGLIGYNKDSSSYYLTMFPRFGNIDSGGYLYKNSLLDATTVRNIYFDKSNRDYLDEIIPLVPDGTFDFLCDYFYTDEYLYIKNELSHAKKNKETYGPGPFMTVDNVLIQAGHVLLVTRGGNIGKGLLALPGGFLEPYETLEDGAIRELQEETEIDIPPSVLRSKIVASNIFDYPYRSVSGHLITTAFLYDLDAEIARKVNKRKKGEPLGLTKVKGSDDAVHADWYPLSSLDPKKMHDDHYHIIMEMLKYKKERK